MVAERNSEVNLTGRKLLAAVVVVFFFLFATHGLILSPANAGKLKIYYGCIEKEKEVN